MIMEKEVVKVNGKYAARFKKWYNFDWRYIGINLTWSIDSIHHGFVLEDNFELAKAKLDLWFPDIETVDS